MKKQYTIFQIQLAKVYQNDKLHEYHVLGQKAGSFDTLEEAEECIEHELPRYYNYTYTIIPTYRISRFTDINGIAQTLSY